MAGGKGCCMTRLLLLLIAGPLALYLLYLAALCFLQGSIVYQPTRRLDALPSQAGLEYEDVFFPAEDGLRLHGWLIPAKPERAVVLFCHGNAGNISHRLETAAIFRHLGLTTFLFDYRGYGQSQGRPSEEGTYADALGAWRWLTGERGVEPGRIVAWGRSLGGAVAAELAARESPAALVLESTFTSAPDLAARYYRLAPARLLCRYSYATLERLPRVRCPVLVVHSRTDEIIPFEHGQRLFEAATQPKGFLEIGGSHNEGYLLSSERYAKGVNRFLEEHLGL